METQKSLSPLATSLILLLGLIWGGTFPAARVVLQELGPLTIVGHRTFWAALLLWGFVALRRVQIPRSPRIWVALGVMGVLNNVMPFSLTFWAQQHIEASLTAILNGATAIFGVLMAAIFLSDERLTLRKLAGIATGFLGVATVIGLEHLRAFDLRSAGQLAVLGAALCYALAGVWARKHLAEVPLSVAAAGMLTAAACVMLPTAWMTEGAPTFVLSPTTLALLAYITIPGTGLAFLLYYKVLSLAGSGNLLLVTLVVPVVAIILSTLFLGETLTPNAFAGFGLLALGLAILDGRILRRLALRV